MSGFGKSEMARAILQNESLDTVKHVLFRGKSLLFDDVWLTEYEMNDGKAFLDLTLPILDARSSAWMGADGTSMNFDS